MKKKAPFVFSFLMLFLFQCICASPVQPPTPLPSGYSPEPAATTAAPIHDESVGTINLVNSQVESGPPNNMKYLDGIQNFFNGDGVRVSGGGKGKLSLIDGTLLTLFNDTEISGVTVTASPREADLLLQRQGFLGNVPPGGNTVIHTPNGVNITILGTNFFILFDDYTQVATAGNFDGTILFTAPGDGQQQSLTPGKLVDIFADGSAIMDDIHFTLQEFEQSADQQGTPLAGLAVLRQRGWIPEPIPTIVTPPTVGRWVGVREDLGGIMRGSPAVASWGPNRLDVFVRGTDDALWHKYWDGSNWSGWESLGGILSSSPAAVSWGPDRIDVFALGITRDLWQITWDGSKGWSGWIDLGTYNDPDGAYIIEGDPAVTSWGPGRLDLFLGFSTYSELSIDRLSHQSWSPSGWSALDIVGSGFSTASTVGRDVNLLDVVTRGPDGQVYYYQGDGSGNGKWQGPMDLGPYTTDAPAITSWDPKRLDLFIRGGNNELMHKFWDGSIWSDWERIDAPILSAPAAVSWGPDRIDVFAAGEKGELLHYWFDK